MFHGSSKLNSNVLNNAHESPLIMNIPLLLLVVGTLFSGMFGYYILSIDNPFGYFAGSIFNLHIDGEHHVSMIIQSLPLIVGIAGILLGIYFYKGNTSSSR